MLQKPCGMWLCSAGLSNPIQLLQFFLPEVSHLETELSMSPYAPSHPKKIERKNKVVKRRKEREKRKKERRKKEREEERERDPCGNELFFLLLFWSFPKYQSINKHEKQLVIHKAFGNSVVIRANWSGSTNDGDGNSSVVWTNLNGLKSLKSPKLQQTMLYSWQQLVICMQKATGILQISCTKWTISITCKDFPCQTEHWQKTSNYWRFFSVSSLLLFLNTSHLPRIKTLISKENKIP